MSTPSVHLRLTFIYRGKYKRRWIEVESLLAVWLARETSKHLNGRKLYTVNAVLTEFYNELILRIVYSYELWNDVYFILNVLVCNFLY